MPELLISQYSVLIFFLLTLGVMVVMFSHHHLSSKKGSSHPHNPLEVDPHTQTLPIDELESYYREALSKTYNNYKEKFEQKAEKAEGEFVQFLADLQVRSQQTDSLIESVKKERIDTLFDTLETRLSTVIDETVTKTLATIQKELEDSRKNVQEYTNKQLSLIDQNAIDLLEKTLSIVLIKKMSLRDQLDLVYEALEKAKLEKFLSGAQTAAIPTQEPVSVVPAMGDGARGAPADDRSEARTHDGAASQQDPSLTDSQPTPPPQPVEEFKP